MTDILSKEIIKEIGEFIEFQINDKTIPCISVTVVGRDDQSNNNNECFNILKRIYTHKDIKTPIPTIDKSLFRVASVSKLFTYVALLQLVDKKQISLDDLVTKYIPDFHPSNPPLYSFTMDKEYEPDLYKKITIFNLIRHTSGLIREPIEGNYFNEIQSDLITLVKSMNDSSLISEPGTQYKYSNAAVAVAGFIVEVVSGIPFAEYVEKNILLPLGMKDSTFENKYANYKADGASLHTATGHMWRYWDEDEKDLSVFTEAPLTYFGMFPAAGLATTLDDISKFLKFFLQYGKPLLEKDTFIQFLTQQPLDKPVVAPGSSGSGELNSPFICDTKLTADGPNSYHGLGIEISQYAGYQVVRHGGAINGFASDFRVLPELGIGIFTVTTLDVCNAVSQQVSEFITCQLASHFVKSDHSVILVQKPKETTQAIADEIQCFETRKEFLKSTLLAKEIPDDVYDQICGYWYTPVANSEEEPPFNDNQYLQIMKSYNGNVYCKGSTISKLAMIENNETGVKTIITADRLSCNQIILTLPKNYNSETQQPPLMINEQLLRDADEAKHSLFYCKYKPLPLKSEITIPPPFIEEFKELIGIYTARDHMALIFEEDGCLNFNIEWLFNYKMKFLSAHQSSEDVNTQVVNFLLSPIAMYNNEVVSFHMRDGVPLFLSLSGIKFKFQPTSNSKGTQQPGVYAPDKCLAVLEQSYTVPFPFEDENARINHNLVDLSTISPTLKLDIKYATTDNFTNIQLYKEARAFLNKDAAQCLLSAHNWLVENWNVGIIVFDSYRPWNVTWTMAESVCPEFRGKYVASPSSGSVHNRGGALDISLYDLSSGEIIEMVGDFDELSIRSHRSFFGGTDRQRWYRKLLTTAMVNNSFKGYEFEWWHFDFQTTSPLPVLNLQFNEIN